jgi:hypothetical protein
MHPDALLFIGHNIGKPDTVLEYGSLNINGTARATAPHANWFGIDTQAGPGVDLVADASEYVHTHPVDVVVCAEVLEHSPKAGAITRNAWLSLKPSGLFLMTCATDGRAPHSAVDGGPVRPDEYYRNVPADDYRITLEHVGFDVEALEVHPVRGDLYVRARKNG